MSNHAIVIKIAQFLHSSAVSARYISLAAGYPVAKEENKGP